MCPVSRRPGEARLRGMATGVELPEIDAQRCVHTRAETAGCAQCVAACPRAAWVLDEQQLALDTVRCDGCGLCTAHCPQGALRHPAVRPQRYAGRETLLVSCDRVTCGHAWELPCVNALGLREIGWLYRAGLRRLVLYTGPCAACPRDDPDGVLQRVARLNQVLAGRARPPLAVTQSQADGTRRVANGGGCSGAPQSHGRRGFLRSVLALSVPDTDDRSTREAPGRFLPPVRRGQPALFVPRIDPLRCSGCDACVRLCPQAAIAVSEQRDAYLLDADACSGCGLCVDVCDRDAVSVEQDAVFDQPRVALQGTRCRSCGVDFHRPEGNRADVMLCPVCTQVDHRRHLFQVL